MSQFDRAASPAIPPMPSEQLREVKTCMNLHGVNNLLFEISEMAREVRTTLETTIDNVYGAEGGVDRGLDEAVEPAGALMTLDFRLHRLHSIVGDALARAQRLATIAPNA